MTAFLDAKICFLSDSSLLKRAVGIVYKDVLQGGSQLARQPSWAFLTPSATHKECAFLPLSELKNLTSLMFLLERPIQFQKSWLENYQNRMHCQLKLRGQRLFQKKKWDPITSWYTAALFYPALLPENPFFGHYRLKIGKRYTDLFKSHLCAVHFG